MPWNPRTPSQKKSVIRSSERVSDSFPVRRTRRRVLKVEISVQSGCQNRECQFVSNPEGIARTPNFYVNNK